MLQSPAKTALFIAIAIALVLLSMVIFWDSPATENEVQEAFFAGDYLQAKELLQKVEYGIPKGLRHLYTAYIERALGNILQSDQELKLAEELSDPIIDESRSLEIYANQMFNAYLEKNNKKLMRDVAKASQKMGKTNLWVQFFRGILRYYKEDYGEALSDWERSEQRVPLSKWMEISFEKVFTPFWQLQIKTDAEIGLGRYQVARQLIEGAMEDADQKRLGELHYLMGKSYLQEGKSKTPAGAVTYYALAVQSFEKAPISAPSFASRKEAVLDLMMKEIQELIQAKEFDQVPFYVSILERWGAKERLTFLREKMMLLIEENIQEQDWMAVQQIAEILNKILPQGKFKKDFISRFDAMINTALVSQEMENVVHYWTILRTLAPNPASYAEQYIQKINRIIPQMIPLDTPNLSKTSAYIDFLTVLMTNPQARYNYALSLLDFARDLWVNEENYTKGARLIEIAATIPLQQKLSKFKERVADVFSTLYREAVRQDNIDEARAILDLVRSENIRDFTFKKEEEVTENLKLAKKFYQEGNLIQAKRRVEWVLVLDQDNQEAKEIMGLIYFKEGNYVGALKNLDALNQYNAQTIGALAVSQILAGNRVIGYALLQRIQEVDELTQQMKFRLAYGTIVRDRPDEALSWFSMLLPLGPEGKIGMALAYFDKNEWKKALELLNSLPSPYDRLESVLGLQALALLHLNNLDEAQYLIVELLAKEKEELPANLSPLFKAFKKQRLNTYNRYFVAAKLYEEQGDKKAALEQLAKIEYPDPIQYIERAELNAALGDTSGAQSDLEKALLITREDPELRYLYSKVMLVFARLLFDQARFADALEAFLLVEQLHEGKFSLEESRLYVKSSRASKAYGLAMQRLRSLQENNQLSDDLFVVLIDTLIKNNLLDSAGAEVASRWENKPPLELQLQLVPSLLVLRRLQMIQNIFLKAENSDELSQDEQIAYLIGAIATAQYARAEELVLQMGDLLQQTPEGLVALARFYQVRGNKEKALQMAYKALAMDGNDIDALAFIEREELRSQILESYVANLHYLLKDQPDSISYNLGLARTLNKLYLAKGKKESDENVKELYEVEQIMRTLIKKTEIYPEAYFLLGKALFYMQDYVEAFKALRLAIEKDPSYVAAFNYLMDIYLHYNRYELAEKMGLKATRFEPGRAESWLNLAKLAKKKGSILDAIDYLRKAIQFQPNYVPPYLLLSQLLLGLNNPEGALEALQKAEEIEPDNVEVLAAMLKVLYDTSQYYTRLSPQKISAMKERVYQKLNRLDPKRADSIKEEMPVRDMLEFNGRLEF